MNLKEINVNDAKFCVKTGSVDSVEQRSGIKKDCTLSSGMLCNTFFT